MKWWSTTVGTLDDATAVIHRLMAEVTRSRAEITRLNLDAMTTEGQLQEENARLRASLEAANRVVEAARAFMGDIEANVSQFDQWLEGEGLGTREPVPDIPAKARLRSALAALDAAPREPEQP